MSTTQLTRPRKVTRRVGTYTDQHGHYRVTIHAQLDTSQPAGRTHDTVNHEPITDPLGLSITADIDRRSHGSRYWRECGGGQSRADLDLVTDFAAGWTAERRDLLAAIWADWHLNDMQAGCAHQTVVWEDGPYGRPQASLTLTEPCPDTGYRYGSAWLVRPLDTTVLDQLAELFGPDFTEGVTA